jgi:hypothetical protein
LIDWSEIERLETYQLLSTKEKETLKEFLANGRDWAKAVYAVYGVKSMEVAIQMARRIRHRQEIREILAQIEGERVPTANNIAAELYRIGTNPKMRDSVRVDALDTAAVLLGFKVTSHAARPANEDERIQRAVEKLG